MEANSLQDIFIEMLRSELSKTELAVAVKERLTPDVISDLYALSKQHDLAHIISSALYKNGFLNSPELLSQYSREEVRVVYRYEQMQYAYRQICDTLDQANISYIPLKGSVIRPYYPNASMRTSCDIDILVKEADLDHATDALVEKGFRYDEKYYHDVSLFSPNNIHLELHFSILENTEGLDEILKLAWDYAEPAGANCYRFTQEFFLFHMFSHMSYHFLSGGCGIKSLMDVWVMKYKMGITYELAETLLKKAGIYKFAREITSLADRCFSGGPRDDFSDFLLSYILNGGVYGTSENKIAVTKAKSNSTVIYGLKRAFLPHKTMKIFYPVLNDFPILLPFCWLARISKVLIPRKRKRAIAEMKIAHNASGGEMDRMKQMRLRLGL